MRCICQLVQHAAAVVQCVPKGKEKEITETRIEDVMSDMTTTYSHLVL